MRLPSPVEAVDVVDGERGRERGFGFGVGRYFLIAVSSSSSGRPLMRREFRLVYCSNWSTFCSSPSMIVSFSLSRDLAERSSSITGPRRASLIMEMFSGSDRNFRYSAPKSKDAFTEARVAGALLTMMYNKSIRQRKEECKKQNY